MIRRYIIWRNNHAYDERLRRIVDRANQRKRWDCPRNGVSGPITPGLMAWRERCRDDRDTG